MPEIICFLVEKPAQFDVPFFRFAAMHQEKWKLVVVYLQSPEEELKDIELHTPTNWGIDLTHDYEWHSLPRNPQKQAIADLYEQLSPALIITNGYKNDYAPYLAVAKTKGIPMGLRIDSVLTGNGSLKLIARKLLMRFKYRQFKGFFTTGKPGYEYLNYIGIPAKQQFWFPYCADNAFFANPAVPAVFPFPEVERKQVIIGICKFNDRENPLDLMSAFCEINDPSLHLVMIGDGPLMPKLKEIASRHTHLNIYLPGYVPYVQLPAWYARCGLFVHPAENEPWGVSVQEALAAGCRVVASSRVGSALDLVIPGNNGFIYPVNNQQQLVGCIQNALLISDEKFRGSTEKLLSGKWNYESVWQELQHAALQVTNNN